ncbi:hypothetical protein E3E22_00100 [Thermococcus sp. MV5]|uniref:hypothetical protein n=1 Tax=Thermococcus sp. MV5 TaxID=1638272 RepID=UPI00143C64CB|nr:hypothetical protein [Thermococcus sp. MV5]NJE25055.1 hypothetical protein [Thermococcus sp. MV5]
MTKKRTKRVSGIQFTEEKIETFEIPLGTANNIKGIIGEKLADAYLKNKIISELEGQYDLISLIDHPINSRYLLNTFRGRDKLEVIAHFFLLFLGAEWAFPITVKLGYLRKEEYGYNNNKSLLKLIVKDAGERLLDLSIFPEHYENFKMLSEK